MIDKFIVTNKTKQLPSNDLFYVNWCLIVFHKEDKTELNQMFMASKGSSSYHAYSMPNSQIALYIDCIKAWPTHKLEVCVMIPFCMITYFDNAL